MSNIIVPGDAVPTDIENATINIGPGIYKDPLTQHTIPSSAGILNIKTNKQKNKQLVYVDYNSKRYIPQTNDFVIGLITGTYGEYYKVSLQNFSTPVLLSMMAFPNATKKNRPNLKAGQAVYARVSQAIPDIETELECIDPTTGKEGGFGLLDESGFLFDINLNFARELLFNTNSIVLEKLASRCAFEISIGINGRVWIKCGEGLILDQESSEENNSRKDVRTTLAAANYIVSCQHATINEIDAKLKEAFKGL